MSREKYSTVGYSVMIVMSSGQLPVKSEVLRSFHLILYIQYTLLNIFMLKMQYSKQVVGHSPFYI